MVQDGITYQAIAPAGLLGSKVTTVRATPGENVIFWATGLGPTNPPQPTSQLVSEPVPTASAVQVAINGQQVTPQFAGLVGSGLYQINVVVPAVPAGDQPVQATVAGTNAPLATVTVQ